MKAKDIFQIVVVMCMFLPLFISGCKKDSETTKVVTLTIAPDLVQVSPSPPATTTNPAIIYNMSVTEVESNQKYTLDLNRIQGFTYDQGYTYKLKVRKAPILNPAADGPITSYTLIEIISKVK